MQSIWRNLIWREALLLKLVYLSTKIKYPHFGGSVKLIKLTQPEPTIILWKEEKRTEVHMLVMTQNEYKIIITHLHDPIMLKGVGTLIPCLKLTCFQLKSRAFEDLLLADFGSLFSCLQISCCCFHSWNWLCNWLGNTRPCIWNLCCLLCKS